MCAAIVPWSCALGIAAASALAASVAEAAPHEAQPPRDRLPTDVRPSRYALDLTLLPGEPRFSGTVDVTLHLERPRDVIWLHAHGLAVREVTIAAAPPAATAIAAAPAPAVARFRQHDDDLAAVELPRSAAGDVVLHIAFDAPWDENLLGLYRARAGGRAYAFTQFESTFARRAFPCLDEPGFKTPFDVTLTVAAGDEAISNARAVSTTPLPGNRKRIRFARTRPLPTYLVAFAVGPFDVVDGPPVPPSAVRPTPLPLRGVATRGNGPRLAYALAHAGAIVTALERYFDIAYPFDKLDLIAVPDFDAGAMENAGAITFREVTLLLDDKSAPVSQRRAFAEVTAHEIAHQWFGDLVTMPWWDDLWLNESFATWMATRIVAELHPEDEADVAAVESVDEAMAADALATARRIREPIVEPSDIESAFDGITYEKGGAVLSMFERFVGREPFRRGVHAYLARHRFESGDTNDFLGAISGAAGRDVAPAMRTFLDQPGVPLVEARVECEATPPLLVLHQRRYLPVGSRADRGRSWRIPVCARYEAAGAPHETCTLLDGADARVPLDGGACPAWLMPNADAAGYFRWALAPPDLARLRDRGMSRLTVTERLSLGHSLEALFASATLSAADVLAALEPLAGDRHHAVATAPMDLVALARGYLVPAVERPLVEAYARRLYRDRYRALGWEAPRRAARAVEGAREQLLRDAVIGFLAFTARDPEVRREAARRGRALLGLGAPGGSRPAAAALRRDACPAELVPTALGVAVEEGGAPVLDAAVAQLAATDNALERRWLLEGIASIDAPALVPRVLALSLDGRLRVSERLGPLRRLVERPETRDAAWAWLVTHVDALRAKLSDNLAGAMPALGSHFCDAARAEEVSALFARRVAELPAGPHTLAESLEEIRLCEASVTAQAASARAFFARAAAGGPSTGGATHAP